MAAADVTAEAVGVVTKACPTLSNMQRAGDIVSISATEQDMLGSIQTEDLGWKKAVMVKVVLANKLNSVPANWYASGQHCFFEVGNGGVLVTKKPCLKICDLDPQRSSMFLAIPGLQLF